MDNRLKREFDYYLAHQDEFVREHNGKVLVIRDEKVFGAFDTPLEAVTAAKRQYEPGTFLVQRVSPGESEYSGSFHSLVAFQ